MADGADIIDGPALDLSDLDARVGEAVGGAQLDEPCTATDIRRWVMAMDYPNPLHWDVGFARASRFGGIVAPQSFTIAMDCGQGVQAALVGHIPGSLLLYGGDEWWFDGGPIRPGDLHTQQRTFTGYRLADTKFAGPTVFASGETVHRKQDGATVARQRATVVRYLAVEAERRAAGARAEAPSAPVWTAEASRQLEATRQAWIRSNREGRSPRFADVEIGDTLPPRVVGPHSVASFTTEQRAFPFNVWGTSHPVAPEGVDNPWIDQDPGFARGFGIDRAGARIDPRLGDGLYAGPASGHGGNAEGTGVGVKRAFGYGASMGAWLTDYLAYWAGHDGFIRHLKLSYRGMALEGDAAFVEAEVTGKQPTSEWGVPLVTLRARIKNQDGVLLVDGTADVELPV
jgi:acyl dehydratase